MAGEHQDSERSWEWRRLEMSDAAGADRLMRDQPELKRWYAQLEGRKSNYIGIEAHLGKTEALYGTVVICRDDQDPMDVSLFHYYLTNSSLITVGFDVEVLRRINEQELAQKLAQCVSSIDGFFLIIGETLYSYMEGLDQFEGHLLKLETRMRNRNDLRTLYSIMDRRYDLLQWSSLVIPMRELIAAAQEVFMDELDDSIEYRRTSLRVERMAMLEKQYEQEIDTLLRIDDSIGNLRGNEIMKTLTVFTTICTPIMALGALWGMNFKFMPELEWSWAYPASLGLITVLTVTVYIWLYFKGWTGDILRGHKKKKSGSE